MNQITSSLSGLLKSKKRFKFAVDFLLADLSDVPFVSGILYAKIRLQEGGTFSDISAKQEVLNHHVCWGALFQFNCRVAADVNTLLLEPCVLRVSIRKESKGGKSHEKLGFVDINLSEYAGSGVDGITRCYLLEGYSSGCQRQDNSFLRVNISLMLQSSDPCFKVPPWTEAAVPRQCRRIDAPPPCVDQLNPSERRAPLSHDEWSLHSSSSGYESVGRKGNKRFSCSDEPCCSGANDFPPPSHSRNPSIASQQSRLSSNGYHTSSNEPLTHSRQPSSETGGQPQQQQSGLINDVTQQIHTALQNSVSQFHSFTNNSIRIMQERFRKRAALDNCTLGGSNSGLNKTRVDNEAEVNRIIEDMHFEQGDDLVAQEGAHLQLYVSKDGSAAVLSNDFKNLRSESFEPVIIKSSPRHSEDDDDSS